MVNKISIVVPFYNTNEKIRDCIYQSLNNLNDKDKFEILMVCDGSGDFELMKNKLSTIDMDIKYIMSEHKGAWHARDVGIDNSSGDLVIMWDVDDLLTEHNLYQKINSNKEDYEFCWLILDHTTRIGIKKTFFEKYPVRYLDVFIEDDTMFLRACSSLNDKSNYTINDVGLYNYGVDDNYIHITNCSHTERYRYLTTILSIVISYLYSIQFANNLDHWKNTFMDDISFFITNNPLNYSQYEINICKILYKYTLDIISEKYNLDLNHELLSDVESGLSEVTTLFNDIKINNLPEISSVLLFEELSNQILYTINSYKYPVSVVIPFYNTTERMRSGISNDLKSLNNKDKFEVIMVCDGSDDFDLMKSKFEGSDLNIRFYKNNENRGPGFSKNVGIDKSEGDYILLWDVDDSIKDKDIIDKIIKHNEIVIYIGVGDGGNRLCMKKGLLDKYKLKILPIYKEEDSNFERVVSLTSNYSRGIISDVGEYNKYSDGNNICNRASSELGLINLLFSLGLTYKEFTRISDTWPSFRGNVLSSIKQDTWFFSEDIHKEILSFIIDNLPFKNEINYDIKYDIKNIYSYLNELLNSKIESKTAELFMKVYNL